MNLFLTPIEMRELTGFVVKAKQIEQLRRMGIPFFINGCGKPVVTVAAVEGRKAETRKPDIWRPAVLDMTNTDNNAKAGTKPTNRKGEA